MAANYVDSVAVMQATKEICNNWFLGSWSKLLNSQNYFRKHGGLKERLCNPSIGAQEIANATLLF